MLYQITVTITPLSGGWYDEHERLVGTYNVEDSSYPRALQQLRKLMPEFDGTPSSEATPRRAHVPERKSRA